MRNNPGQVGPGIRLLGTILTKLIDVERLFILPALDCGCDATILFFCHLDLPVKMNRNMEIVSQTRPFFRKLLWSVYFYHSNRNEINTECMHSRVHTCMHTSNTSMHTSTHMYTYLLIHILTHASIYQSHACTYTQRHCPHMPCNRLLI